MDLSENVVAYLSLGALTIALSIALLFVTKIPTVVIIGSSIAAAILYSLYAKFAAAGYWDKFAIIAFVFMVLYSCAVSFALLGVGRALKWPFFLSEKK